MRSLVLMILVLPLAGCAAVLGSKQKDFNLTSAPPAADVYLNGNRLGRTPLRVKLSNQATHTFVFRKEGYSEATCSLNRGTGAGWVILDVLMGLVPIVIDAATNSWSQTKGDSCTQSLEPLSNAVAKRAPSPSPQPPIAPAPAGRGYVETDIPTEPAAQDPPPTLEPVVQNPADEILELSPEGQQPISEPTARDSVIQPREQRRAELVDDVPQGTNWVADSRTRTYYRAGCPVTITIPVEDRLYYRNDSGLKAAGFNLSHVCSVPRSEAPTRDSTVSAQIGPLGIATPPPSGASSQSEARSRSGFWFNGGLGWGSLGCQNSCDSRVGGLSGGLSLGGTLSQKVVLGVGSNGWYKSENGVTLSVGTLTALIRFYPSSTGGFFLLGGLGLGTIQAEVSGFGSSTETGAGALVGLGYDLRVGKNVSLTPFWNGFAIRTSDDDANVGQIGLSLTVH